MSSTKTQWILELVDKITKPLRNITSFGNKTKHSLGGVDRMLDRVNRRSHTLSRNFRRMAIAGAALGFLSASSITFEHAMARTNTMAQVGTKELANYTNQIRDISEVVPKSKAALSDGLFATISAGVPKDNWITFLKDSSKAAYGGMAEIGTVVDTTASIIKAYGAEWNTAIDIQDRLQKTVELGQITSLESLATALPRVTAVSSKLKVSQEELFATFATASGVMGKPAEVATQLNAVLSALLKPGAEATKMANKLGIAFDSKSITRSGGLKNYIDELMPKIASYSKLTGKTQESIIGDLFGSQEAIKLVIGLGGTLSDSWNTNTNKIANATGSVNKAFNIMAKTTKSQTLLLKNSFSNMLDGVVSVLAPFAVTIFKVIAKVFKLVSSFMRANPVLSKFIIIATALVGTTIFVATAIALVSLKLDKIYLKLIRASLGTNIFTKSMAKASLAAWNFVRAGFRIVATLAGQAVGYVLAGASMLGSFIVGLISATAAQWGLNIALTANPIGLIVIGIAAAVVAIVLMIKYWDKIKSAIVAFTKWIWNNSPFKFLIDLVDKIFPGFKNGVKAVFNYVKNLVFGFWEAIKKVWSAIKSFFGFGETTEIKVSADVDKLRASQDEYELTQTTSTIIKDKNSLSPNSLANGSGNNTEGGGSGKTITMTLNITNNFKVSANVRESIDRIADKVVGTINDRLRDELIIAG